MTRVQNMGTTPSASLSFFGVGQFWAVFTPTRAGLATVSVHFLSGAGSSVLGAPSIIMVVAAAAGAGSCAFWCDLTGWVTVQGTVVVGAAAGGYARCLLLLNDPFGNRAAGQPSDVVSAVGVSAITPGQLPLSATLTWEATPLSDVQSSILITVAGNWSVTATLQNSVVATKPVIVIPSRSSPPFFSPSHVFSPNLRCRDCFQELCSLPHRCLGIISTCLHHLRTRYLR